MSVKIKVSICTAKGIILALVRDHPAIVFSYKERLTSLSKMPSATRSAATNLQDLRGGVAAGCALCAS